MGAYVSKEDINQKFLRSLPPSWSQIALIMRNKPDIDEIDIDDLYNNLRVYEDEMKKSSTFLSNNSTWAFLSFENTNSTNEVSTASGDFRVSTCWNRAFLLENVDLEGVKEEDLNREKWQEHLEPVNYALMAISSSSSSSSSDSEACSFMLCDLDFEPLSLSLSSLPSCDLMSLTNMLILLHYLESFISEFAENSNSNSCRDVAVLTARGTTFGTSFELAVHCCGLEFRVLNGYDQKSFDEERGLNCVVQTSLP
ncbi:hypothetical protein Tco_0702801 [Tanacetum coccineum]|uniref:Uncharacterized protein n=1 Tax=Tanacetum coccineum TaxID=301880 RepID=A0ABQ4XX22_9ASTR